MKFLRPAKLYLTKTIHQLKKMKQLKMLLHFNFAAINTAKKLKKNIFKMKY
jgi:hypothetical protein